MELLLQNRKKLLKKKAAVNTKNSLVIHSYPMPDLGLNKTTTLSDSRFKILMESRSNGQNISELVQYMNHLDLSDDRLGTKLRVTENRCLIFDCPTYV